MSGARAGLAAVVERVTRPSRMRMYRSFIANERAPLELRRSRQDADVAAIAAFAAATVPLYRGLFARAGLAPDDIHGAADLPRLPVVTRTLIREDPTALYPDPPVRERVIDGRTGGSTGQPLRYRMSSDDYEAGVALLYRGWGYAGYRPGDSMVIIAGGSLTSTAPGVTDRIRDELTNRHNLTSYGMTEARLAHYARSVATWRPDYVRGYASSLLVLARTAMELGIAPYTSVRAVFSTAECLAPAARSVIEDAFGCSAFDTYGLNDGGVSAYECGAHAGLHVDMERAVLEVVDEDGLPVTGRPGRILATSLRNRAMPFVRYDTGDIGVMATGSCPCGRTGPLLTGLLGRKTDVLVLDGVTIGSPVLTVLMGTTSAAWYQVVQTGEAGVTFRIVNPDLRAREADEVSITDSMRRHVGDRTRIQFEYLDHPDDPASGDKHRIVLNRWAAPGQS